MSYKFVIKEVELEEGALEDYYNKLAKAQGAKTTRGLGIQEPSNTPSGPDPRIAAYHAKKKVEKEKADKATAAAAEKQRKAGEKQYARGCAGLEKQDKLDQKAAAQKTIDAARREIGFLTSITREMRTATGLGDATLQLALDAITQKYIGRGTLAEADEPDIRPLGSSAGAAIFKKYYGDILDAQAFSDFQSARQIIDFLYLYEQNLQKVQEAVKQKTGGKQLKINPKLVAAFKKTNKYMEQITGNPSAPAAAATEPTSAPQTQVAESISTPSSAQPTATEPVSQAQTTEPQAQIAQPPPEQSTATESDKISIDDSANWQKAIQKNNLVASGKNLKQVVQASNNIFYQPVYKYTKEPDGEYLIYNFHLGEGKFPALVITNTGNNLFKAVTTQVVEKSQYIQDVLGNSEELDENIYKGLFDKFLFKEYREPNGTIFKVDNKGRFILKY